MLSIVRPVRILLRPSARSAIRIPVARSICLLFVRSLDALKIFAFYCQALFRRSYPHKRTFVAVHRRENIVDQLLLGSLIRWIGDASYVSDYVTDLLFIQAAPTWHKG